MDVAVAATSATAGRVWTIASISSLLAAVAVLHACWRPTHGINGWTGEPKDKYYALRGWKV